MPKYNIYKIAKVRQEKLIEKLTSAGLNLHNEIETDELNVQIYLSEKPESIPVWWAGQYAGWIHGVDMANAVHFGAIILSNDDVCYAISLGKSHFYLREYADLDFGLNLGTRIADPDHFKRKHSRLFGGNKNKAIILYQDNSGIEFESGESIDYFKARSLDQKLWGKTVCFGTSVQLVVDRAPEELPLLIADIEAALKGDPVIDIPRATIVQDATKEAELDALLVDAILSGDGAGVEANELSLSGIEFVFRDDALFQLRHGRSRSEALAQLSVEDLQKFVSTCGIDLHREINKIKISTEEEGSRGLTKPLKCFLDFVSQPYFLKDGKWYQFNQDYLRYVEKQVDTIPFVDRSDVNFSKSEYAEWLQDNPGGAGDYRELYFNKRREDEGYVLLDRDLETFGRRYRVEKSDLMGQEEDLFYVKIGKPASLGYAADQAMVILRLLPQNDGWLTIQGRPVKPKTSVLWLVFERKNQLSQLSEVNSLILFMKICEWQRLCRNHNIDPVVYHSYVID